MKTKQIIFALSLALIFVAGFNTANAQMQLKKELPVVQIKAAMVNYVVRIEHSNLIANIGGTVLVMMTDENGLQVAPAQTFRPGISDYRFWEGGTVRGTRVAKLLRVPFDLKSPVIASTSRTGTFYSGTGYLFIISPLVSLTISGTDIR